MAKPLSKNTTFKTTPNLPKNSQSLQEQIDELRDLAEENLRYTKSLRNSENTGDIGSQQELQKLLKQNLEISKDLHNRMKKISHWVATQRVWGVVKILIILVPLVLGAIYLPPLIQKAIAPYQDLLNLGSASGEGAPQLQIDQNLINQIIKQFQNGEIKVQEPSQ